MNRLNFLKVPVSINHFLFQDKKHQFWAITFFQQHIRAILSIVEELDKRAFPGEQCL